MNIGIDIDDTISKTFEYSYPLSKEYTKNILNRDSLNIEDVSIGTHQYLRELNKWNEEEADNFWAKYYKTIIQNVEPKEAVIKSLKKLKLEGHKIFLITARIKANSFDVALETKKWLDKNEIVYDELIIDALKKDEIAKKQKIDLFIDDSFTNCMAVTNIGIKSYLIDSPVNRGLENNKICRVFSWDEIYKKINVEPK